MAFIQQSRKRKIDFVASPLEPQWRSFRRTETRFHTISAMRLLLADGHAGFREALREVLERQSDLEVVGEASNGAEAVTLAKELTPDVITMEVMMPEVDGITATRGLVAENTGVNVLGVSTHADSYYITQLLAASARGYVLKESGILEIMKAVGAAARGEIYLCAPAAPRTGRDLPADRCRTAYGQRHGALELNPALGVFAERQQCAVRLLLRRRTYKAKAINA
jgi:DNA-binding NarL/FixJ family response regulator